MPINLPSAEQVRSWIRTLRGQRRDESQFLIATLLATGSGSVGLLPAKIGKALAPFHPALVLGGLALVVYALWIVRIWRQAQPRRREITVRPAAIKGPSSFGPQDGELFLRLGREHELGELLGLVLDDQVGLIVLMGESGAGKTSLLRSGLYELLDKRQQPRVPCAYWEVLPSDPQNGLLQAVRRQIDSAPTTFNALAALDDTRRVVVLDQLEQLDPDLPPHRPVFDLLRRIGERQPPFRVTWILAFRREFDPVWRDFEIAHPAVRCRMLSLKRFPPQRAQEVLATLAEAVELTLDEALAKELVHSASDASGMSPVDLGIGMLVLDELARSRRLASLSLTDYRFAGGSEALLASYLLDRLSGLAEEERSAVLKALLLLADLASDHRVAEGRTLAELAAEAGRPTARMASYLDDLVEARLLERVRPDRYRLQHERLIQPLRSLTGQLLAEADRARILLRESYGRWLRHPRAGALLAGADLRLVLRHRPQLLLRDPETVEFLRLSRTRRAWRWTAGAASLLLAGALLLASGWAVRRSNQQAGLVAYGLPADLLDYTGQLRRFHLSLPMATLQWLPGHLEELEIDASLLREAPPFPRSLTQLTVSDGRRLFAAIPPLPRLEALSLPHFRDGELPSLGRFPRLRRLDVETMLPSDAMLTSLSSVKSLEELTIRDGSPVKIKPILLPALDSLRSLTVEFPFELPQNGFPKLRTLRVFGSGTIGLPGLRDDCKSWRRLLPSLERLEVRSVWTASFPGPECFPHLQTYSTSYRTIPASRFAICNKAHPSLQKNPDLRELTIMSENCMLDTIPPSIERLTILGVLGEVLPRVKNWKRLQALEINNVSDKMNFPGLGSMQFPGIKVLSLAGVGLPSLAILSAFPDCEQLELLSVTIAGRPLASLEHLPALPRLRVLRLSTRRLSDLRGLPQLPKLESLDVQGCTLKTLKGLPPSVRELHL